VGVVAAALLPVALRVAQLLKVPESVKLLVGVCEGVGDALKLVLPKPEEAPAVRDAVGDRVAVLEPLTVVDGVGSGVTVPLTVGLPVALPVGVCEGVGDALKLVLPDSEGEAPAERDAVGDRVAVLEPLTVVDGVGSGVAVPLTVGLPVALPVGVCEGVGDALKLVLPEPEGEAPAVRDAVGDRVAVLEPLTVVDGVGGGVAVPLPEALLFAAQRPPCHKKPTAHCARADSRVQPAP
jgi:hypothetical protein